MAINLLVSPWVVGWIIVFNTHPKIHCKHLQLTWPTGETAVLHKADQIKLFAALRVVTLTGRFTIHWLS